jgi:hypothetical protein
MRPSVRHRRALLVALLGCGGCAQHFTRVDFKYDSNAYLRPAETLAQVPGAPAEVVARAAAFATRASARITHNGPDRVPQRVSIAPNGDEAWQAKRALFEAEWQAFNTDQPGIYFAIDRRNPLLNAHLFVSQPAPDAESYTLRAELPARIAQHKVERNLGPLVPVWWTESHSVPIASVLYVQAFRGGDDATWVHVRAAPKANATEARPGAWVAYDIWRSSTGLNEARLVQEVLAFLASPE